MKYKIAVLSDSHGNASALKAVLDDAKEAGADEFWSLGDIAFGGAGSEECFQLLESVNTTQYLMGNWEASYNEVMDKSQIDLSGPGDVYFLMLARYDYQRFSKGRNDQLRTLPMTARKHILDRFFSLSHNLPNKNFGHELLATADQKNFDQIVTDPTVDAALFAHIHMPLWRYTSSGQLVLNPGSVGQTWFTRPHFLRNRDASYLLLTISEKGIIDFDFRRIPFDIEKELAFASANGYPYVDLYQKLLTTGYASTHDQALLAKVNQERGYKELAAEFVHSLP
ncbi:MAG: metallophosphoesterase family protein [Oenococcus sp.]|uniref:metallophosphoesterase family protein n=1 Tax=Oenococcus sp. TaxID=1979414 RepID=UPI0039ED106D